MKAGDLVEVKQDMDKANAGTLGVLLNAPGVNGDMDHPTLYLTLENMHCQKYTPSIPLEAVGTAPRFSGPADQFDHNVEDVCSNGLSLRDNGLEF